MEVNQLILPNQENRAVPVRNLDKSKLENLSDEKKKQIAKDFESLLLNKLFDQMKDTIGDWGFEKDGASSQVQGMFWLYLANDIANKGGMGLWKEIYKTLTANDQGNPPVKSLEGKF